MSNRNPLRLLLRAQAFSLSQDYRSPAVSFLLQPFFVFFYLPVLFFASSPAFLILESLWTLQVLRSHLLPLRGLLAFHLSRPLRSFYPGALCADLNLPLRLSPSSSPLVRRKKEIDEVLLSRIFFPWFTPESLYLVGFCFESLLDRRKRGLWSLFAVFIPFIFFASSSNVLESSNGSANVSISLINVIHRVVVSVQSDSELRRYTVDLQSN